MNKNGFSKSIDIALLVYCILKRLGCGGVDTFEERLKSQKVQYFAQLFGVSFSYPYNLYLRGPYSPELANDLYLINKKRLKADEDKFVPEELEEKFTKLQKFVSGKDIRVLELSATLHWLINIAKLSQKKAEEKLIELKQANPAEVKTAHACLKNI